jgi:protein-tyrosine phosphatase
MQERGVERVLCLLEYSQLRDYDNLLGRYKDWFRERDINHVPVPDHRLMEADRLSGEILPFLDESVQQERRVVVHCKAGIGRTGQVLAAWLVYRHDYSPAEAVEKVKERYRRPDESVVRGYARQEDLIQLLESVR